jgi:hypothetical protein
MVVINELRSAQRQIEHNWLDVLIWMQPHSVHRLAIIVKHVPAAQIGVDDSGGAVSEKPQRYVHG